MYNMSRTVPVGFWQELRAGWHIQASVIGALLLKDFMSRANNGKLGMFWMIVEPIVTLVMLAAIWYLLRRQTIDGVHVALFLSSGLIIFGIIRHGLSTVPNAVKSNSALLNYPQVKPLSCIFARFIFQLVLLLFTAIILYFLMWWFMDLYPVFNNPLATFQVIGIAMAMSLGASLILGVYATLYDSVGRFFGLFSRPLMFLSCVIHSMNDLPAAAHPYLLMNPIVHLVDIGRSSLFAIPQFPKTNLEYPAIWSICLLGVGTLAYYANRFRLIQE